MTLCARSYNQPSRFFSSLNIFKVDSDHFWRNTNCRDLYLVSCLVLRGQHQTLKFKLCLCEKSEGAML